MTEGKTNRAQTSRGLQNTAIDVIDTLIKYQWEATFSIWESTERSTSSVEKSEKPGRRQVILANLEGLENLQVFCADSATRI